MSFYSELSRVYDVVFPLQPMTLSFLEKDMSKGDKILDLACGKGSYSISLSEKGYDLCALDLDGDMIKGLKKKAAELNLDIKAYEGDMTEVDDLISGKFRRIFCIGNSLVHLKDSSEILVLLKKLHSLLEDHGDIIIQIVNYDRILDKRVNTLPTLKGDLTPEEKVIFHRSYSFKDENTVSFDTELIITENSKSVSYKNSIPLIALRKASLIKLLEESSFSSISCYGDFKASPFSPSESFPLIIKAAK
ncbi:class I SAM-dependent methyltransferase [Alloiococcus sp. CFN-8]|uniref:class I SAM-dependent methyltransferase n=1 Tax=Alloiococcus sp. CFN-8 TaxID=3416081 RepID=UPI003CFA2619